MKTKPFLFSGRIENCFDSHVHWRATGGFARRLRLHDLRSPEEIKSLNIKPENFIGKWLLGYGWDQNHFTENAYPTRETLDQQFGDTPVYFMRVDGHAAWVNTAALKLASLWEQNIISRSGGKILLSANGYPTGILIDLAMQDVQSLIPDDSDQAFRDDLLAGQKAFHLAGFTHIRDLTCDEKQWQVACDLEKSGELKLAVEQFFSADDPEDFGAVVNLAMNAKKEAHTLLCPKGVKVFFDGALGSEGALLSQPYKSGSGSGLRLLSDSQLTGMMAICFKNNLELAVHTIGDEAAHIVAKIAYELHKQELTGKIHLEHTELLRPETIEILKGLNVTCHFQPCHWLSDKKWLKEKIGDLTEHAFRWKALEDAKIKFYFGSDSPIEQTSLQNNLLAIADARECGIPAPETKWELGHSHPHSDWCPSSYTEFLEGMPVAIQFRGEPLL